jgi:hypothetical protein
LGQRRRVRFVFQGMGGDHRKRQTCAISITAATP